MKKSRIFNKNKNKNKTQPESEKTIFSFNKNLSALIALVVSLDRKNDVIYRLQKRLSIAINTDAKLPIEKMGPILYDHKERLLSKSREENEKFFENYDYTTYDPDEFAVECIESIKEIYLRSSDMDKEHIVGNLQLLTRKYDEYLNQCAMEELESEQN